MKPKYVVFTQDNCLYCDLAKTALDDLGHEFEVVPVSEHKQLFKLLELKTVPQIFEVYDGITTLIGGYTELCSWLSMELNDLDKQA